MESEFIKPNSPILLAQACLTYSHIITDNVRIR